jgi:enoyl-CoA hydratase/carnithine racemase
MSELVVERHGAVQVCRLNRPQERNGLTGVLLRQYLAALEEARTDDAVRVVVTTGEGDAFSAGADMSDLDGESARQGLNVLMHEMLGSADTLSTAERTFDRLGIGRETLAVKNFDKPLIAAVNGTLPRAIGLEAAMDVMFTGRSVSADEALAIGMVLRKLPHERLMDEAMAYAEQIAAQAPIAVQLAKRTLARSLDNSFPAQLELEWPYQVAAFDTDDAREGIIAFRERRPPRFSGR